MMPSPRPYQLAGRDFLASRRFALLADEMRVGKTPQAILAAEKILAQKTIVVCPAIATTQWANEWWRWWPQPGAMPVVVSYDRLRLNAAGILAEDWDLAIVDEAHFAKNPQAKRTKLVYGKGGLAWKAKRLWALSGTPAPKHAGELWAMLRTFGVVKQAYFDFLRSYCVLIPGTFNVVGTKERRIPELREMLAQCMLRRTRKEVAPDMPAIAFEFLDIEPQKVDVQVPDLPEEKLLAWLAANQTQDRENRIAVAQAKIPALVGEILGALEGGLYKQTVVFGWHLDPIAELVGRLAGHGVVASKITGETPHRERQRIQEDFRSGKIQVIVANILAAGTAIDLSAASHGYFLELDWVPGNNNQAANRLVSMEKKEPVTFDVLRWEGSADDRVQSALLRRTRELSMLY